MLAVRLTPLQQRARGAAHKDITVECHPLPVSCPPFRLTYATIVYGTQRYREPTAVFFNEYYLLCCARRRLARSTRRVATTIGVPVGSGHPLQLFLAADNSHFTTSSHDMVSEAFVVVAGVGSGTGASVARRFA